MDRSHQSVYRTVCNCICRLFPRHISNRNTYILYICLLLCEMVWRVLKFSVQFPTHITPYRLPQLSSVDFTLKSSGIQKHRFKWAVKSFNQNSLLKYLYEIKFLFIHNNSKVTLQYFFSNFVGFQRVEMCAGASACLHCVVLVSDAKHITAFAQLTWKCIPPFFLHPVVTFCFATICKTEGKVCC